MDIFPECNQLVMLHAPLSVHTETFTSDESCMHFISLYVYTVAPTYILANLQQ